MDFYLEWGSDLVLTPTGSLQTAVGWDQARERIIRRFLTNRATTLPDGSTTPPDYIFSPGYGEGAGALVDQNPDDAFVADLTRRMRQAVLSDASVDPGSVPQITVTQPTGDTYEVFVDCTLSNGQPGQVSITLG